MKTIKNILYFFLSGIYMILIRFQTRSRVRSVLKRLGEIKLEIGAGEKKGINGWITLDMAKSCDLRWDLRNGIPFPDESVSIIYSSHLFEHLTFSETAILLAECKRVLMKNGRFSICVPNARLYIEAYLKKDEQFWKSKPSYWKPAYNKTTGIDLINYIAYMDGQHKYLFDEENVLFILNSNGFRNSRLRGFDPEVDLGERHHESLYAEAEK